MARRDRRDGRVGRCALWAGGKGRAQGVVIDVCWETCSGSEQGLFMTQPPRSPPTDRTPSASAGIDSTGSASSMSSAGIHANAPGGLFVPGLGYVTQFQIGRGLHQHGTELPSLRLVLYGADPDMLPPQAALQEVLNVFAHQVMSQVAQARNNAPRRTAQSVIDELPRATEAAATDATCAICQEAFAS